MQAREIRRAYLDMLVAHGHVIIPRAPLVLRDDPTTLPVGDPGGPDSEVFFHFPQVPHDPASAASRTRTPTTASTSRSATRCFGWIVGLLTAVAVELPLLAGRSPAIALAQSVIHLVIGLAIGSLVAGAARSAVRVRRTPYDERFAVE